MPEIPEETREDMVEALTRFSHSTCPPPAQQPTSRHLDGNIDPRLLEQPISAMHRDNDTARGPSNLGQAIDKPRKDSAFASTSVPTSPKKKKRSDTLEGLLPGIARYLDSQIAPQLSFNTNDTRMSEDSNSSSPAGANASQSRKAKTVRVVSPGQDPQRLWEEKQKREAARGEEELRKQEEMEEIQYEEDGEG